MNIALRDVAAGDAAWLDAWLPAALEAIGAPAGGCAGERRIIERDGEPAGVIAFRVDTRERRAILLAIAVLVEHARRGSGMRAAALIEEELRRRGVQQILAPAPEAHGIAVYFWVRLGYRPALRDAWPCDAAGITWFERTI